MKPSHKLIVGLTCIAFLLAASSVFAAASPRAQWSVTVKNANGKTTKSAKVSIDLVVQPPTPPGGQTPPKKPITAEWTYAKGSNAQDIAHWLADILKDNLNDQVPGHGITVTHTKGGHSIFAKGSAIKGMSWDAKKAREVEIEVAKSGFRQNVRSNFRFGSNYNGLFPYTPTMDEGVIHFCFFGMPKKGNVMTCQMVHQRVKRGCSGAQVALALKETFEGLGWEVELDAEQENFIMIKTGPEQTRILGVHCHFEFIGEPAPGPEQPAYHFLLSLIDERQEDKDDKNADKSGKGNKGK